MGMAASQATLLTLTSRMHDVELRAQNIENQKIALATQKDEMYQEYMDALDAKKIQVAFNDGDGSKTFVDASFSSVCGYDSLRLRQYSLTDTKTGKVIVDEHTANTYEAYSADKYSFAWAMLDFECQFGWEDTTSEAGDTPMNEGMFIGRDNQSGNEFVKMTEVEQMVFDAHQDDSKLKTAYDEIDTAENAVDKRKALDTFRDLLYKNYSNEIYEYMNINKQETKEYGLANRADNAITDRTWDASKDEFNYYIRLWEEITNKGGCQPIDAQYESGDEGEEWFNNMVKSGLVVISEYNPDKKEWLETSVATSTNGNYLQEVSDETDLKKAEAKYQYELGIINKKDSKYDRDLSKLETERTAMKQEMDAIKTERNDNIERTFNIFN